MPASKKSPDGPLASAAAALETEIQRYEETVVELERAQLTSDKTVQRARKILEDCAAHQTRLAELLPQFAQAMQEMQVRQQRCMEVTSEGTQRVKTRFEDRMALLERVAALGKQAQALGEPVAAVLETRDQATPTELLESLSRVTAQTEAVIEEAEAVHRAAEESEWLDIARDADTLRQQLQSARNKVLVAQRSVANRAPS